MLLSCSHWSAKPVWLNLGQHICLCSGVQLRQHFCSVMRFHPQRGHALGVCYRAACLFGLRCMEIRWKEDHLAPGRGGIPKAPVSTGRIYHLAQPISLFLTPIQTTIGGQWENTELICTMHFTSLQALKSTVSFLRCSRDGPVRCYYNCWQISSFCWGLCVKSAVISGPWARDPCKRHFTILSMAPNPLKTAGEC